jgi:hypothetical protein
MLTTGIYCYNKRHVACHFIIPKNGKQSNNSSKKQMLFLNKSKSQVISKAAGKKYFPINQLV